MTRRGGGTKGTLGTFAGVFTPSVLTILGIILFRRLGYVVGSAGLLQALGIIALANVISLLTSVSVAAIATNLRVKGGGDYYLISRTLGLEFGGAIGIVLFLAQSVSIAFYCLGFGEALTALLPWTVDGLPRIIAAVATVLLFFLAWKGADWATRFQYVVMVVLVAALVSFFWGGCVTWSSEALAQSWEAPVGGVGFWLLFAIFFPAVTGFTQGVSMSGDLEDPGRSIPQGTFVAVGLSAVVYIAAAVVFAAGLPRSGLTGDYEAMGRVARFAWLIDAGVIAATLSSAMASFLGAPRILQALASDKIFPVLNPFAAGVGPSNNPRRGVVLSLVIAAGTVSLGNLNVIAPVVSMFFLVSYGLLNYATYFEARAASPSFRPRFRWFSRHTSLAGALGCLGAMLAIHPTAGLAACAVLMAIYQYLKRTAPVARWADGSRSHSFQVIREHLLDMQAEVEHPRDWRPQILAFSRDPQSRSHLLLFASWIEGGAGLTSAAQVMEGSTAALAPRLPEVREELATALRNEGFQAFPLVVAAADLRAGFDMLLQAYGVGPLRANIVLLNWHEPGHVPADVQPGRRYGRYLREAICLERNIVALKATAEDWTTLQGIEPEERRVDVWWWGDATSRLSLLLAYLMTRTVSWEDASIRVLAPRRKRTEGFRERLEESLDEMRVDATAEVVEVSGPDDVAALSKDAALVFLALRLRGLSPTSPIGEDLGALLDTLPVTALVLAGEDIDLTAEPDEGKPAEMAAAADAAEEAEERAQAAEAVAEDAAQAAEEPGDAGAKRKRVAKAEEARGKARRAREKANKAEKRAEDMGALPPKPGPEDNGA